MIMIRFMSFFCDVFLALTMICFDGDAERDNFILQLTLYFDLDNLANVSVVADS